MSRHRRQQHRRSRVGALRRGLAPVCALIIRCRMPCGARLVSLTVDRVSRGVAYCTAAAWAPGLVRAVDSHVRVTL